MKRQWAYTLLYKNLMKKLIACMAIVLFSAPSFARNDKDLHTGVSFVLTSFGTAFYKEVGVKQPWASLLSGTTTFIVGYAKEQWIDDFNDPKDLQANASGIVMGMGLTIWF